MATEECVITLRNSARAEQASGYGRINAGLLPVADSRDDLTAPVQLFISPPYSFRIIPGKFNVGLTMCERPVKSYDNFDFVGLANQCQLLLVPNEDSERMFKEGGITVPIRRIPLGHDHASWYVPFEERPNRKVFILDRGRDNVNAKVAGDYFELDYYRCSGQGTLPQETLKDRYAKADIFVKWATEPWSYPVLEAMSAGCLILSFTRYSFLSPANSLTFSTMSQFRRILLDCRRKSRSDLKRAGQKTAEGLSWCDVVPKVRDVIREEFAKWKASH